MEPMADMYLVKVFAVSGTNRLIDLQCFGISQAIAMEAWMIEAAECPINVRPASLFGHTVGLALTVCLDTVLEHPLMESGLDTSLSGYFFCLPCRHQGVLEQSWEAVRLNPILVVAKLEDLVIDCKT